MSFIKLGQDSWPSWIPSVVPIITIILADIAHLGSVGSKILLEKDWIVVVSRKSQDRLAKINAVFTSIDLLAFMIGPLTAGLLFDFASYWVAATFIGILNLITLVIQFRLLM